MVYRQHLGLLLKWVWWRHICPSKWKREEKLASEKDLKMLCWDLQDGGGVEITFIKNTSTCGTAATEHLLNAGRRPQTSQKARNSPCTWGGQKKKEKTETKERKGVEMNIWSNVKQTTRKNLFKWKPNLPGKIYSRKLDLFLNK